MKRILFILLAAVALGGALYALKNSTPGEAQEKQRRRDGERSVVVETAKVEVGDVAEQLTYVGSLLPKTSVAVSPKITGRIEAVFVEVGDWVKKGQLLARMEKREIEEEVREAEASLKVQDATLEGKEIQLRDLKRKFDRSKVLLQKDFVSRQEVDDAETQYHSALAQVELAKAQTAQMKARLENVRIRLRDTEVVSPFAGYVAQRHVDRGAMVKNDSPIVLVVDLDVVKTVIPIVEREYRKVGAGLPAVVTVDAYSGQTFSGRITRMAPVLNQETRTADAEIEIPNSNRLLKPGMFSRVTLTLPKKEKSFVIPESALVRRGEKTGVFRVDREGRSVQFVSLEAGVRQEGKVAVVGPVAAGDQVVTLGSHLLESGARIRVGRPPG